jgi:hypothetical protein
VNRWRSPIVWGLIGLGLLCILFLIVPKRIKPGTGHLELVATRWVPDAGAEKLDVNALNLKAQDMVQFGLSAPSNGYAAIVADDGKRTARVLFPSSGLTAEFFSPQSPSVAAPVMIGVEKSPVRVWGLFSRSVFPLEWAIKAIERGQSLDEVVPTGVHLTKTEL